MSLQIKKTEDLKQVLKNAKGENIDLYQHLLEVFDILIKHYPDQALDKLEEVSYLKKTNANLEDFLTFERKNHSGQSSDDFIQKAKKLFEIPKGEGDEEAPAELPAVGNVPDLLT